MAIFLEALGGMFPTWLIAYLLGKFVFKEMAVLKMLIVTTLIAAVASMLLSGFGNADGGPYNPNVNYLISGAMLFPVRYLYWKMRA